jgi:deoxyribonuclease-4
MPLFGAHTSISGGLHNAVATAVELGCEAVQIFTKNASQWNAKPLSKDEIRVFRQALEQSDLQFPTAHDSYLINLASPDDAVYRRSIDAFVHELERAESLGLSYLVMHPGAHMGSGEDQGVARVVAAFDEVHQRCKRYKTMVLIETTAGQGTTLGWRFEHIAAILAGVRSPQRLGVCVDTCHLFAAGYPLGTARQYAATFDEFDRIIGLDQIKLFHVNDSAKAFGSRVDRHAGLGLGELGLSPFRRLVRDSRFQDLPMILETPKEGHDGEAMDPINLAVLNRLQGRKAANRTS